MPSAIIVEDEVLAAERLRVLLEECNVVLLNVFHHAMPALEWLSVHEVDIVFADIGMPEIDGLEFVERIKRTAKRQPEIVFTTAYEEHALRAFELAAADYLLKPIKMTRLQTALDRIIEKNREKADSFTHFKVYNRERMVEIPWQQARYLMAEHKTVYLFTGDGQIRLDDDENDEYASTWGAKILDIPTPLPVSRRQLSTLRKIIKNSI